MSDNYLTVIPTDPYWRPDEDAADRAAAVLSRMLPDDDARRGLEATRCDRVEMVFCGSNLERIACPHCGAEVPLDSWGEAVDEHYGEGFPTLLVTVPCCDLETSLNELVYDWPMGFARFRIEIMYPNRAWLSDEELATLAEALGHPLRQILIHI
ncbi:zinc ribbon domain-containing protein [Streptomyces sp. SDr-06]|uniref:zinc ribbon domain-containing protein n=1 Tax=Streptomyces sp. SDr-06 TaxID=2267702 RepID=UPI000DE952B3|nr:zinc ribbon domain-containing protein [Streptomyces sp. SDr-06]RCH59779.1 zinc ribbon domain-containing protein [Streptomyces sp. SDr-06]